MLSLLCQLLHDFNAPEERFSCMFKKTGLFTCKKLNSERLTVWSAFLSSVFFKLLYLLIRSYQVPILLICPLALSHFLKFKVFFYLCPKVNK